MKERIKLDFRSEGLTYLRLFHEYTRTIAFNLFIMEHPSLQDKTDEFEQKLIMSKMALTVFMEIIEERYNIKVGRIIFEEMEREVYVELA